MWEGDKLGVKIQLCLLLTLKLPSSAKRNENNRQELHVELRLQNGQNNEAFLLVDKRKCRAPIGPNPCFYSAPRGRHYINIFTRRGDLVVPPFALDALGLCLITS